MAETKQKTVLTNRFTGGMYRDSLPSLQPENTYREAWNAVLESDEENSFGISNENSNEIHVDIPGDVRGLIFAEERDQYVTFIINEDNKGEIGIIDNNKKCYTKLTDKDVDITCDEWVDADLKYMGPCNDLHLYFSTNDTYKYVNLDDPCCKFEVKELLKADCIPAFDFQIFKKGGALPNGTYWFSARLRDAEGNDSNWFKISKGIHISGKDHIPGQNSKKAINVKLNGLHRDYSLIDIAVTSIVAGEIATSHVDTVSYGEGKVDYLYRGRTGRELPLDTEVIRARNPRYIKGKNLMQYDGRLVLYNIRPEHNLDYQRQANNIQAKYVNYAIPARYADQFKGLRPNENYWFGIQWNYVDGTSSVAFDVPGRKATQEELNLTDDNCSDCRLPAWRLKDTSSREKLFLEDVHDTNGDYNDDVSFEDNNRDGNYIDDKLDDTEKDTVDVPATDIPTKEDLGHKETNIGLDSFQASLDCICEFASNLVIARSQDCDFCEDDDMFTHTFLAAVLCMCAERTVDDTGEGEPAPLTAEQIQNHVELLSSALTSGTCTSGNCGGGNCGQGGCGSCGGGGCGGAKGYTCGGGCNGTSCKKYCEYSDAPYNTSATGRALEAEIRYAIKRGEELYNTVVNAVEASAPCTQAGGCEGCTLVKTSRPCFAEGREVCSGSNCEICIDGYWHSKSGINVYDVRDAYKRQSNNRNAEGEAKIPFAENFSFEYIYDEDGCEIVGVKPSKYSQGKFGYWETKEKYPLTKDCNCEYIYGDEAGKPVRLHRVPSVVKEPHFVSFSGGVPNLYDMANVEDKNSFVFLIGVRFEGVTPPKNPPKPLCPNNPFSIVYVERTEANKSVIGSGIAISTFKGQIQGEPHVFPKIGVNSFERFNRVIEPTGDSTFRGGVAVSDATSYDPTPANVSPYIIHSADFHFRNPPLDATDVLFELELYGKGFRHGLYAEDIEGETFTRGQRNQKGTRQSLILNHYRNVRGTDDNYLSRCVTSMTEVYENTKVSKSDEFKYSLCNLWGESCVYTELEGPFTKFVEGDKDGMGNKYGGVNHNGDEASDRSFTGDTLCHAMPIHDVRSHYVTFTRYIPYQYGSPIGQTFIPLGLEANATDFGTGVIEGLCGDSFVGAVSFKRSSYVSDKTNRKIFKPFFFGLIEALGNKGLFKFFGSILKFVLRSLGLRTGGYVPASCDYSDHINKWGGLREHGLTGIKPPIDSVQWGEKIEGNIPLPKEDNSNPQEEDQDRNRGDNYFPHVVKSNVWTWMNSDCNPAYRELGDPDNNETYWPYLKGRNLDSSMPDKQDWTKTYLNRFYSFMESNPKFKMLIAAICLFLFIWWIGIYIVVIGVTNISLGLQAFGGGTYGLQTIGGALALVIGIALAFIGVYWIVTWIQRDEDNKMIEGILGIKNIRPDVKNPDGSYSMYDGRLKQFEDNYWEYNQDLSYPNRFEYCFGMPDTYNTCYCPEERSTKVVYSNKQRIGSPVDSWKNFKLNNMIDIAPDNGKISKIFKLGSRVFVHTTDMLLDLQTGSRRASLDKGKLLLGSGDLFGTPQPIFGGVVEGYAGLKDPNAAYVSNWGYIFPDRESRQYFLFSGDNPTAISDAGMRGFLQENLTFKLLEKFPDFANVDKKSVNGIGFSTGVDHQHNRLLFTKIDYDVQDGKVVAYKDGSFYCNGKVVSLHDPEYFCNKSFTLSFHPDRKVWVSFHSYAPRLYAWDRFRMFSFGKGAMHRHNVKGSYQTFYGDLKPFMVEAPIRTGDDAFTYYASKLHTEAFTWKGCDFVKNSKVTFDKLMAYNSFQNTGDLIMTLPPTSVNVVDKATQRSGIVSLDYSHRAWIFSNLKDRYLQPDELMFDCSCSIEPSKLRNNVLDSSPTSNLLKDNYLIQRYTFDSKDDVKLFMKRLDTKVDVDVDFPD